MVESDGSSDEEIIRWMQSSDDEAVRRGMEELLSRYGDRIEATVRVMSPGVDHHGLKDIRQDVYVRLRHRLRDRYRHDGKLWAYMRTVIRGVAVDHYRHRKRIDRRTVLIAADGGDEPGAPEPAGPSSDRPDERAVRAEQIRIVRRAVTTLGDPCREVIGMHYTDGLKYREIAKKLGISVGTVSSRLARCLERLAVVLHDGSFLREQGVDVDRST